MRFVFKIGGQESPNLSCSFGCRCLHEKGCTVSADRRAFNKSAHYFFFILSESPIKAPATFLQILSKICYIFMELFK